MDSWCTVGANYAPVAQKDIYLTMNAGEEISCQYSATDVDGDNLVFQTTGYGNGGFVIPGTVPNSNGQFRVLLESTATGSTTIVSDNFSTRENYWSPRTCYTSVKPISTQVLHVYGHTQLGKSLLGFDR